MIGEFDDQENWARAAALGVANYGQMTAAVGCISDVFMAPITLFPCRTLKVRAF